MRCRECSGTVEARARFRADGFTPHVMCMACRLDAAQPAPRFVKHDDGKLPLDLLPFVAIEQMARVLAFGARKYTAHGWRNVDKRSRYLAAALRHLVAYARGEDLDDDSGLPHLAHAMTCVAFLVEAEAMGLGEDDRPSETQQALDRAEGKAK